MSKFASILIGMCLLAATAQAPAQIAVKGRVDVRIAHTDTAWVGQQLTLEIDVLTTGFSFTDVRFTLPEVSGAFLMQTDTSTIKLTENRLGESWQILRYSLSLFPLRSGELVIPPITVRYGSSAGFGTEQREFELPTQRLTVDITLPPGAREGGQIVSTSGFDLEYRWDPEPGPAKPGDAFTLTVTRRAEGISAMLLPPVPVYKAEGLAAYPDDPRVSDRSVRGQLTGERTDAITWVAERAGQWTFPDLVFQWWDPRSEELKQRVVPGFDLQVSGTAAGEGGVVDTASDSTRGLAQPIALILLLLALAVAGWLLVRRLRVRVSNHRPVRPPSEAERFSDLRDACRSNDASRVDAAAVAWLSTLPRSGELPTLTAFAIKSGDEVLQAEVTELQRTAAGIGKPGWNAHLLLQTLVRARTASLHLAKRRNEHVLPTLNP